MQDSDIPAKIPVPWATGAGGGFINPIPQTSQIGIHDGYASWPDGFVPLNALPIGGGGVPPRIQDTNGVLNTLSLWQRWMQAGGPIFYDAAFAASIGGYPKGARLPKADFSIGWWTSTIDNNTSDPDTGGANWTDSSGSTSQPGLVQLASSGETYSGLIATKGVTPSGLFSLPKDPTNSLHGYWYIAGGMILQYIDVTLGGSPASFSWPIAFPNACRGFSLTDMGNADATLLSMESYSASGGVIEAAGTIGQIMVLGLGY